MKSLMSSTKNKGLFLHVTVILPDADIYNPRQQCRRGSLNINYNNSTKCEGVIFIQHIFLLDIHKHIKVHTMSTHQYERIPNFFQLQQVRFFTKLKIKGTVIWHFVELDFKLWLVKKRKSYIWLLSRKFYFKCEAISFYVKSALLRLFLHLYRSEHDALYLVFHNNVMLLNLRNSEQDANRW